MLPSPYTDTLTRAVPAFVAVLRTLEPGAWRGELVSVRDLRRAMPMDKATFDALFLAACRSGLIGAHRHDHVGPISAEEVAERCVFVPDEREIGGTGCHPRGHYYIGAAVRQS